MGDKKTANSRRLGTQFRGKLAAAYGDRGHSIADLWYVYSPRDNKDWVLRSDLEWDHFVLAESDSRIASVDYNPDPVISRLEDGTTYRTTFDALVTYIDQSVEWREVKPAENFKNSDIARIERQREAQVAAADQHGVKYARWTEVELYSNFQKLVNWRRIISWLSAARDRSLSQYQTELAAILHVQGSISLGDIAARYQTHVYPLYVAAAFHGVQRGLYFSDVDKVPLSVATIVSLQEPQS